jgi:hypothetical protein
MTQVAHDASIMMSSDTNSFPSNAGRNNISHLSIATMEFESPPISLDFSHLNEYEAEVVLGPSIIILQQLMSLLNMVLEKGLQDSFDHRISQHLNRYRSQDPYPFFIETLVCSLIV